MMAIVKNNIYQRTETSSTKETAVTRSNIDFIFDAIFAEYTIRSVSEIYNR